jgi:hypothetical protein
MSLVSPTQSKIAKEAINGEVTPRCLGTHAHDQGVVATSITVGA